jgi:methionyl-tRNA formyltransferase
VTSGTPKLRVAFLGNAPWSVPSLDALAASEHQVVLVATRDARPAGRGHQPRRTPVAVAGERLGLPLAEVPTVKRADGFDALRSSSPDVLAVVAYGEILPPDVLEVAALIPVNVHFSLLPRWRGAAPVQRAILAGDTSTGVTTIRMTQGLDEGPILLRVRTEVGPEEDAGSLGSRLAEMGARALVETLEGLASGTLEEHPQGDAGATYAPRLGAEDRRIEWSQEASGIVRRVRALSPEPGAVTSFRGRNLKVLRAVVSDGDGDGEGGVGSMEGQVGGGAGALVVRAGDGWVELVEVAPEGRRRMSGTEFVRGQRPRAAEVLS